MEALFYHVVLFYLLLGTTITGGRQLLERLHRQVSMDIFQMAKLLG